MKPAGERYTIAVDFDGVIHRYDSPWVNAHTIPDRPVDGAISWLFEILQKFDVVIFSTRCKTWRGRRAIRNWLWEHAGNLYNECPGYIGIEDVKLSYAKPPALVYLDDRALRFEGEFPNAEDIHRLRPWNNHLNGQFYRYMTQPEPETQLAVQEPSVALMLQEFISRGVTVENVSALEKMCNLYERMQDRSAQQQFNGAFSKLQSELPQIAATKPVPNNDGSIRYRFAPFEEIMEQIQPFLTAHGFSVSFNSRFDEGRMVVACKLRHISGHSETNEFSVRIGQGPPRATETQSDGAAKTYAKRGALCDCLNISVDHDDDARMVGKPIGKALGKDLEARVKACGADREAFLKFAGAANFESISDDRFDALDAMLTRKESGKAARKDEEQGEIW